MKKQYKLPLIINLIIIVIAWTVYYLNTPWYKCEKNWNIWKKVGRAQIYACITPYPDWWKNCVSSQDCAWNCIKKDIDGKAFCEKDSNRFWCSNTVENIAKGEGILCID